MIFMLWRKPVILASTGPRFRAPHSRSSPAARPSLLLLGPQTVGHLWARFGVQPPARFAGIVTFLTPLCQEKNISGEKKFSA